MTPSHGSNWKHCRGNGFSRRTTERLEMGKMSVERREYAESSRGWERQEMTNLYFSSGKNGLSDPRGVAHGISPDGSDSWGSGGFLSVGRA